MRRLLGLKQKDNKGKAEKDEKENSNKATASPPPPPPPPKQIHGLGLSLAQDDDDSPAARTSRHVAFVSSDSQAPTLHPQPSFESRHGTGAISSCFPRSVSTPPETTERPGQPKPVNHGGYGGSMREGRVIGVGSELSNQGHGAWSPTLGLQRTTSPLSLTPSGGGSYADSRSSPYLGGAHSSLGGLAERHDPSQILAPLTWSQMAHQELVENVSPRERTRQEVLWEVVASEERYVLELRSLVTLYVLPLLHPLVTPPSSPPIASSPSPPIPQAVSANPRTELPIAARFLRAVMGGSEDAKPSHWDREMPEIGSSESSHSNSNGGIDRSRNSLPARPRDALTPSFPSSNSTISLGLSPQEQPQQSTGRLSSSLPFRHRHPLRPAPSSTKLHKSSSRAPPEVLAPPALPDGLRRALQVMPDMLAGHEELSARLREQWAKAFPLVRGLAGIWSDQPWFLDVYAKYILSLEEALATIDSCLPSTHSQNQPYSARLKPKTAAGKEEKRLTRVIMSLEEAAACEDESGLAICLSKPLQRLSKLPLLMQALLYHTDAAASYEYERTRAMALEIDALVRSIEDEKVEEEEREKVRDIFARVDGIKDKTLMAPRSSRTVIEEIPIWHTATSKSPEPPYASSNPRRTVSDVASRPPKPSDSRQTSNPVVTQKPVKRLSDLLPRADKPPSVGSKRDLWLIVFSDVTIRCQRIGETEVPGPFSREKEKQGKQGKVKKGRRRNLYRFLKIERWELREVGGGRKPGLVSMEDISRIRRREEPLAETSDEDEDDGKWDAESRMSFSYDDDDPRPTAEPRNFRLAQLAASPKGRSVSASSTTRSTIAKQTPAMHKFGTRLRLGSSDTFGGATSPTPSGSRHRYDAPTAASLSKRAMLPSNPRPNTPAPPPPRVGASSSPPTTTSSRHVREDSTLGMYQKYWIEDENHEHPIPFPSSSKPSSGKH